MEVVHRGYGIAATSVSVAVLGFLAAFQVQRGSGRDLAIYVGLTLVALAGIGRTTPRAVVRRPTRDLRPVVLPLAAVVGVLLAVTPRYGPVDVVVLSIVGVGALVLVWGPDDQLDRAVAALATDRRRPLARAAWAWLGLVAAAGVWQLVSYFPGPTFSDLVNPRVDEVPGRAVFVVVWLLGLCGLLRHAWRPLRPDTRRRQAPASAGEPT